MNKSVATWIGIAIALAGIVGTALTSAADYGRLEQRVAASEQRITRTETQREKDSAELQTIRIIVTRICAQTPGCRD